MKAKNPAKMPEILKSLPAFLRMSRISVAEAPGRQRMTASVKQFYV